MSFTFKPSENLSRVAPSATIAMSRRAKDKAACGLDVINLSAGEPDFATPEHICAAARDAIAAGKTGYTVVDGITELKQAAVSKFARDNDLAFTTDQIHISPGGKASIFNAFMATLNPDDEVIIPAPCWVSYPEMVKLCGAKPVIVPTTAASDFKITQEQLSSAITPNTKWLCLNSPNNPTGAVINNAEYGALAEVLRAKTHVMVMTDDIYEHIIYEPGGFATLLNAAPDLADRTLIVNGVSKAYAMTGWRIGVAAGPRPLIAAMGKVISQTTSNACSISQWASVAALSGVQEYLVDRRENFRARRDVVASAINHTDRLSCMVPGGAFYIFADCSQTFGMTSAGGALISDDLDFCNAVLDEALVALVPGSAFHAPGHFRLSYASSREELDKALTRLGKFCADLV
ncbi:pyridoxal phosphate-dependent aminotransferase [Robiginitomaculum antarcticum]|uniref:pyridoxal phosphate-dependent aminotransferase n=1 Tax=Robiginitomaculum antarcticum TaxID=437507 RepID=UPI000367B5EA|nr:pyridoxal phosphate-dependent aminotransferase [Robiginitomaculum antarcticum]